MRTLWFRFWVDVVSESLVWLERRTLTLGHRLRIHRFAVWLTFRESWLYHRALDLAGIGLSPLPYEPPDCPHGEHPDVCATCWPDEASS